MFKKCFLIVFLLFSLVIFVACDFPNQASTTNTLSDFEIWRNSDDALDYNEDRKIDISDYEIYLSNKTTTTNDVPLVTTDTPTTLSDYEIWRNSDDARDFNGDRKINDLDYEIYLIENDYYYWKDSEYSEDLNADSKIDELDHNIFKLYNNYNFWKNSEFAEDLNFDSIIDETDHIIYSKYDTWKNSKLAEDLNGDLVTDVFDYEIYLEFAEFKGSYYITNYTYVGEEGYHLTDSEPQIYLKDLGQYLSQISFTITANGTINATIPEIFEGIFGDFYVQIAEGLQNMEISRTSPFIVVIDTHVSFEDFVFNMTMYLVETDNGYSVSYEMGYFEDDEEKPVITFDIIKAE